MATGQKNTPVEITAAKGKLGILIVGLGAVATTFVAGVEAVRHGIALPIGSLTQMGTIRLGKRTDGRSPLIKDFVPLADLDDLVFGGWDIFNDSAYEAAANAKVLEKDLLLQLKPLLDWIKPMAAVFDPNYIKKISGPNVKTGKNKRDLAEQLRADIRNFKKENGCDRLVMIWCASTESFQKASAVHASVAAFEAGLEASDAQHCALTDLRLRGLAGGRAVRQWSAQPHRRSAGDAGAVAQTQRTDRG